jgi:hypothetical protein
MPWVLFTEQHCWTPPEERRVSILFKPTGVPILVRKHCADEAVRLGRAKRVAAPKRDGGSDV